MKKNLLFLLLFGSFVAIVDLTHVISLLAEESSCLHDCIVQIHVATVFLTLKVKVVKQLHKSLVELSNLNLRWAVLNLSLNYSDVLRRLAYNLTLFTSAICFR